MSESLREQVAQAMFARTLGTVPWAKLAATAKDEWLGDADAALAVVLANLPEPLVLDDSACTEEERIFAFRLGYNQALHDVVHMGSGGSEAAR